MVKVSPQLMRLQAFSSVYSMVSRYIKDPKLREAFSFHSLLIGGNPFTASSIYTLIHCLERKWGVFFPKGGMGALVAALVKLYEDIGGQLRCNEEIERVLVEGNHVRGLKVRGLPVENFNLIVSNADVVHTYRDLIPTSPHSSKRFKRLANSRHSMSLFLIYFGTRKQYNNLAHHNIFFGPRYRELLSDIFERGILAGDFSLYLHAPCRTDPSLAPSGCDTFYVLSPVPHLGQGPIDWKILGPKYARKILESLQSKVMPDLLENIITQRIFTPLDFQQELNSHWGSAFSLEPTLSQSAYFRVHNKDSKISGLYFVGAGTHPGAGIPGVINSGRATYDVIMRDYALGGETKGLVYAVQTN